MKWLSFGILGLSLVIFCVIYINKDPIAVQKRMVSTSSDASIESNLRAENRELREQVVKLSAEIALLKANTAGIKSSQPSAVAPPAPAQKTSTELAKMQAQVQEFDNFLNNGDKAFTALQTSFNNEPVDASWATENQRQLESFFKKSFTNVYPQYIECRSQRCRITIPVFDHKQVSELSQTIMQGIFKNEDGIAKKIIIEPTTNDGTLNFYLAKNDEVSLLQ